MEILVLLIPLSLLLVGAAAWMFLWAVNNGQFDALDRHAFDILDDDSGEEKQ
ncbi:MAG: cbb3-type cytochrome oxidase assembly protein CcoS [Pseudomonadales bacterium]